MRRVVVTGLGIVSSIGISSSEVTSALRNGKSGISFAPEYAEHGFRSQIHGKPNIEISDHIDKRVLRFMGEGAAFNYIAMQQAVEDSGLSETEVSNERTGLIMGSGGPSTKIDTNNKISATGNNQKEMLFILGKAISGAPIMIGTNQLPKPPIIAGITIKKIIINP